MNEAKAKQRIKVLSDSLNRHNYLYHVLDRPEISDHIFDTLKNELTGLEKEFPELTTADSPTQRIGGQPLKEFKKFKHAEIMPSLNDSFDFEDVKQWADRIEKISRGATRSGFYCELKIDGLALELVYKNKILKVGATRGDGIIGEDVTQNIKTINAVPLSLLPDAEISKNLELLGLRHLKNKILSSLSGEITVRGEIFIDKTAFRKINAEQAKIGERPYANPRNLAAGSIRQLDPQITKSRGLDSYAYNLKSDLGQVTHEEEHIILQALGFKTNPHNTFCKNIELLREFRNYWDSHRDKLSYEIDGIVAILNNNQQFNKIGFTGRAPRAAIAYKFAPVESQTTIENIVVQVGRTGTLTPVAILKPVKIGGTTVSRATLHNLDEINRLQVKIGDTVVVGRAGDVIPDIKLVLKELRSGKEKKFFMPKNCPICNEHIEKNEDRVAYRCINKNCPAIRREGIYHFASRRAFNIEGIGPKIIDQLMEAALIKDSADLFYLKKEDLLNLERFANKSAENTISSIRSRKNISLDKFIYALGIDHVGEETASALARKFTDINSLGNTDASELEKINDIGRVVAVSIHKWFRNSYNMRLLDKLRDVGIKIDAAKPTKINPFISNKIFVLTGSLDTISRDEAKDRIRNLGGNVSSSVSKETDYVVAGSEAGSKLDKAIKLNLKIIREKEFLEMLAM